MDRIIYSNDARYVDMFEALALRTCSGQVTAAAAQHKAFRRAIDAKNPFTAYGHIEKVLILNSGEPVAHASLCFDSRLAGVAHLGYVAISTESGAEDALFEAIADRAHIGGAERVRGPINGNTWQEFRYVTGGSMRQPFFLEPFCSVAPNVWARHNFVTRVSYESVVQRVTDAHFSESDSQLITIERLTPSTAPQAIDGLHAVALDAFKSTWSFIPISVAESAYIYAVPLQLSDTLCMLVARDQQGVIVGFLIGSPDLYDASGTTFIFKTVGVRTASAEQGIGAALFSAAHAYAVSNGFEKYIYSTMQNTNEPIRHLVGRGKVFRTYEVGECCI